MITARDSAEGSCATPRIAKAIQAALSSVGCLDETVMTSDHFGAVLRSARESRGLTVADVSRRTRIKELWLTLIEETRIDELPAPVFPVAFLPPKAWQSRARW